MLSVSLCLSLSLSLRSSYDRGDSSGGTTLLTFTDRGEEKKEDGEERENARE